MSGGASQRLVVTGTRAVEPIGKISLIPGCRKIAKLGEGFMSFATIHAFISFAIRAEITFNRFDKPESNSSLFLAGMAANWTVNAGLGLLAILIGDYAIPGVDHFIFLRHVFPFLFMAVCPVIFSKECVCTMKYLISEAFLLFVDRLLIMGGRVEAERSTDWTCIPPGS
jgi:hypothetical protein